MSSTVIDASRASRASPAYATSPRSSAPVAPARAASPTPAPSASASAAPSAYAAHRARFEYHDSKAAGVDGSAADGLAFHSGFGFGESSARSAIKAWSPLTESADV